MTETSAREIAASLCDPDLANQIAKSVWERIKATSANPEYFSDWDEMLDTHPAKAHHLGTAVATINAVRAILQEPNP